jgi:hypothetical protein
MASYAVAELVAALRYKVTGSILDGFIGIFHLQYPSGLTVAQRSTHHPTEMNSRDFLGDKGGGCVGLDILTAFMLIVLKSGILILLEP